MGCENPLPSERAHAARQYLCLYRRPQPAVRAPRDRTHQAFDRAACDFPYSGRPSEIADIRELPIVRYPYIVFYTVDAPAEEVLILRVRHTSQDPAHHLD
jgi:plasmid stabilization system protein ParE